MKHEDTDAPIETIPHEDKAASVKAAPPSSPRPSAAPRRRATVPALSAELQQHPQQPLADLEVAVEASDPAT